MAQPPESIEEVLPAAKWVVEAEVIEVLESAPASGREAPAGSTGTTKAGRQVVKLEVKRVLRGTDVPRHITAVKPEAGYALKVGSRGPFLLDGTSTRPKILGAYGPDTWRVEAVEESLRNW